MTAFLFVSALLEEQLQRQLETDSDSSDSDSDDEQQQTVVSPPTFEDSSEQEEANREMDTTSNEDNGNDNGSLMQELTFLGATIRTFQVPVQVTDKRDVIFQVGIDVNGCRIIGNGQGSSLEIILTSQGEDINDNRSIAIDGSPTSKFFSKNVTITFETDGVVKLSLVNHSTTNQLQPNAMIS